MGFAFEVTEQDVETVLRANAVRVLNSNGRTFAYMAEDLLEALDLDAVESAALDGGTELYDQTDAAHAEIERQLVEQSVLKG